MNGGIFIPLGPGIPPAPAAGVNGFCGFSRGFFSGVAAGVVRIAALGAVGSFALSSGGF